MWQVLPADASDGSSAVPAVGVVVARTAKHSESEFHNNLFGNIHCILEMAWPANIIHGNIWSTTIYHICMPTNHK